MNKISFPLLGLKINAGNSYCSCPMICHYFPSGQKRFTAVLGGQYFFKNEFDWSPIIGPFQIEMVIRKWSSNINSMSSSKGTAGRTK